MLHGQKHTKCSARPICEPFLLLLFVCILFIIKVYVSSSLPISKMKIKLVYLIYFGHSSILFCLLENMLIKLEVLKFKLTKCNRKKAAKMRITHTLYFNSCTYHSALSLITISRLCCVLVYRYTEGITIVLLCLQAFV